MKNNKNFFLIVILSLIIFSSSAVILYQNSINKVIYNPNSKTIVDYWDRKISVDKIPQTIVSFSPSITEFIYEIGYGDRIVGISGETIYPNDVNNIEKLAYYDEIDFDKIYSIRPQIVFASKYTYKEVCKKFEQNNIPVIYIEPTNYSETFTTLDILGDIFDASNKTNKLKNKIKSEIYSFVDDNKVHHIPNILFVHEINPLYIAGNNTLVNDIISLSGGKNAASNIAGYSHIENSEVKNMNIDIIILSSNLNDKLSIEDLKNNDTFMNTNAVKHDNVFFSSEDELYINPSTRFLKPIMEVNSQINIFSKKISLENSNE